MPIAYRGLIEELFIATNPKTGKKDVYFRNYDQTVALGLSNDIYQTGTFNSSATFVKWGQGGDRFVAYFGSLGSTSPGRINRAFVYKLNRSPDRVYDFGAVVTATKEATYDFQTGNFGQYSATCTIPDLYALTNPTPATEQVWLAVATYAPPYATTLLTAPTGSQQYAIDNFDPTASGSQTLSQWFGWGTGDPITNFQVARVNVTWARPTILALDADGHLIVTVQVTADFICPTAPGANYRGINWYSTGGAGGPLAAPGVYAIGTVTINNAAPFQGIPFQSQVSEVIHDVTAGVQVEAALFNRQIPLTYLNAAETRRTHRNLDVRALDPTSIKQRVTDSRSTKATISVVSNLTTAFLDAANSTQTITVLNPRLNLANYLVANAVPYNDTITLQQLSAHRVMWTDNAGSTFMADLHTGISKKVNEPVSSKIFGIGDYGYRLLNSPERPDIVYAVGVSLRYFPLLWDNTQIIWDQTNPFVSSENLTMSNFKTLAALPSGVSEFLNPNDFQFVFDNNIPGVYEFVGYPEDSGKLQNDSPSSSDPSAYGIIVCHPTTEPAAFIARFPGATGIDLDITAAGRITENKFTPEAQNYDDEPVIAYLTSASSPNKIMLPQELQSTGDDLFRCIMQTGLQAARGADDQHLESLEPFLRRGPGIHPGGKLMYLTVMYSDILNASDSSVGSLNLQIPGLNSASPVKAVVGSDTSGRFFGFRLFGTNVDSVFQYLGAILRGRDQIWRPPLPQ